MNFRPIFYVNGILLLILSAAMLLPALVDLAQDSPDWKVFAGAQIVTGFSGFALIFMNRQKEFRLTLKETFLLVSLGWIFAAAFGALPFCFAEIRLSYTKAFFEAMSGITATGSTVITGLDALPRGILFWRALLHWLGGIGFLVTALAVLPALQISGMQIFRSQAPDIDKAMPNALHTAFYICLIYAALTAACALLLLAAGMTAFEAVCHAMSALATGGFSTSDDSIAYFKNPLIEDILVVFMILASLPFVLYLRLAKGDARALTQDSQVRAFFKLLAVLSFLLAAYLFVTGQKSFFAGLQDAAFMIASSLTTTSFVSQDFSLWGPVAVGIAFLATFIGGCSGSTAGGIKIFRIEILWLMLRQQANRLLVPHGVFQLRYGGKTVATDVQMSVAAFFFIYVMSWFVLGVALQLTGLEFTTAFSGALAAISNTGAALGEVIGPAGNFSTLPAPSIWLLSAAMLFGRLEFLTLIVLLLPRFWKD